MKIFGNMGAFTNFIVNFAEYSTITNIKNIEK